MSQTTLEVNHLCTSFFTDRGESKPVNDVSFTVPEGSIVGIVGESGCGKSMTARSIMRLLKYPGKIVSGEIKLCGKDILSLSEREMSAIRGKEISMIFQEPMTSLNPVMKAGKQVEEALMLHNRLSRRAAKAETIKMFEKVGIPEPETRYGYYPHEMSGGMRQRVMIAMAMICRPKLLIADEPTTALDVTVEAQILHLMKMLRDETGTSIILISHNLGVIAEICDRVHVMYAGRIVESADTIELFRNPRHPYTKGLMRSVVSLESAQDHLDTIPGMVPQLLDLPKGCSFSPRCEGACDRCRAAVPELKEVGDDHLVRCFEV